MSTTTTEAVRQQTGVDIKPDGRRDLATQILHAVEEAYAKQLEPRGGKEDMWQGGDVYYPNPPKMPVDIIVGDLTGREAEFSLGQNGFCLARQTTEVMKTTADLQDTQKIKDRYYPEMRQWLQQLSVMLP